MALNTGVEAQREPFVLEKSLDLDRFAKDCVVIDVGRDEDGKEVLSYGDNLRQFIYLFNDRDVQELGPIKKLYVTGDWNIGGGEATFDKSGETSSITFQELEWNGGNKVLGQLIEKARDLEDMIWISSLPITEQVLKALPTSITKLVLDLGQPVRLDANDNNRPSFLKAEQLKPLVNLTNLKECRLFNMKDSYQSVIWETVYRNNNDEGLAVLELSMADAPIVRKSEWVKADDVRELKVVMGEARPYKGNDGRGLLHHEYGMGEYLDDLCMRKGRLASGVTENKPLRLSCLKLNGFVIDYLPFEHELSQVALLVCGDTCVDAGLRAPKTSNPQNKWAQFIQGATTHCMIDWPNWTGIFNKDGKLLNFDGSLIESEVDPITAAAQSLDKMVLSEASYAYFDSDYYEEEDQNLDLEAGIETASMSSTKVQCSRAPTPEHPDA